MKRRSFLGLLGFIGCKDINEDCMSISKQWWLGSPSYQAEQELGTIYSASSWSDLSSFTQNGITASVNGSNQIVLTGTSVFTKTLDYDRYSRLEKWSISMQFVVTADVQGAYVGMRSKSTYQKWNLYGSWSNGLISIQTGLEGSMATQGATVACAGSSGQTMELTLTKDKNVITCTCRNVTTGGATSTKTYTFGTSTTSAPLMPNTGKFCISSYTSNTIVKSISISSTTTKNARVCFIVDSIGETYCASVYDNGYVRLVNASYPTSIICGGQNDTILEGIALLPELLELNARTYVLCQGINDAGNGVPSATYIANYDSLVSSLVSSGKRVVHQRYYSSLVDMSALWNHINSTYNSSDIVDTITGLVISDLIADGIHMNNSGNLKYANNYISSGKL